MTVDAGSMYLTTM